MINVPVQSSKRDDWTPLNSRTNCTNISAKRSEDDRCECHVMTDAYTRAWLGEFSYQYMGADSTRAVRKMPRPRDTTRADFGTIFWKVSPTTLTSFTHKNSRNCCYLKRFSAKKITKCNCGVGGTYRPNAPQLRLLSRLGSGHHSHSTPLESSTPSVNLDSKVTFGASTLGASIDTLPRYQLYKTAPAYVVEVETWVFGCICMPVNLVFYFLWLLYMVWFLRWLFCTRHVQTVYKPYRMLVQSSPVA